MTTFDASHDMTAAQNRREQALNNSATGNFFEGQEESHRAAFQQQFLAELTQEIIDAETADELAARIASQFTLYRADGSVAFSTEGFRRTLCSMSCVEDAENGETLEQIRFLNS